MSRATGREDYTGRVRVNMLAVPGVLSTVRSPFIPRASSRLIASQSPVPSCGRVRPARTWTNGSKIASSLSAGIPLRDAASALPTPPFEQLVSPEA